nr:unnamed protein product [Digitaria exilis]
MLRLRACGGKAPALVPALVRARLARRASSAAAYAAAATTVSASSALEELAAERKGGVPRGRSGHRGGFLFVEMPKRILHFLRLTLNMLLLVGLAKVVLKKGKTQIFRDGSPMVYSGAVDRIIGRPPPKSGDIVLVADGTEKPIGWGLYNSVSMFCVRLMQLEEEARRDPACALNMERLLEARISSAVDLRRRLGLPSADTNAYRLINSEGDRLSGLIVDIFADVAVIASSAAWVEKYREEIQFFVSKLNGINHIKWRPSEDILKEEGLDVSDYKEPSSSCSAVKVDVLTASIDSSGSALNLANENIILNELSPERISFVKGDATAFMKGAVSSNELWDMVLQSASGMYRNLNALAMQVVKPGGLLMTCSCSGAMTQSGMFLKTIQGAALMADRKVTVLRQTGAACDHPIDPAYPEGQYLSNYLLRVS